jgi:hypothetical protein
MTIKEKVLNLIIENKSAVLIAVAILAALGGGYATGRYAVPAKVTVKTEVKVVEKIIEKRVEVEKKTKKNDKTTVIVEITKPDGTKEKRTMIVDKGETNIDLSTIVQNERDTKTDTKNSTVTDNTRSWQANGLVGYDLGRLSTVYGIQVERRLFGPVKVGVFGMTNKTVGASVGIEF